MERKSRLREGRVGEYKKRKMEQKGRIGDVKRSGNGVRNEAGEHEDQEKMGKEEELKQEEEDQENRSTRREKEQGNKDDE